MFFFSFFKKRLFIWKRKWQSEGDTHTQEEGGIKKEAEEGGRDGEKGERDRERETITCRFIPQIGLVVRDGQSWEWREPPGSPSEWQEHRSWDTLWHPLGSSEQDRKRSSWDPQSEPGQQDSILSCE